MEPCPTHTRAMNPDCRHCNDRTWFLIQTILVGRPAAEVDADLAAVA